MNIQIFGRNKCFDTKKAERYFKERRIKYQLIDIDRYGMSKGELTSVKNAVGLQALPCFSIWRMTPINLRKCWMIPSSLKLRLCETASRQLWAISLMCGPNGNKR